MSHLYYMHEGGGSSSSSEKFKDLEGNQSSKAKEKRRKKQIWVLLSKSSMVNAHIVTVTTGLEARTGTEEFGLGGWFLKQGL
ncbi:hypothetical protein POPTR_013G093450v4 [Populus trichocarpa]|uniref:Uncharacterized protein n=1 Tax=Populus trichocarpa TaxID=3694 RepID=A0ACC0S2W0_POPTR|nr:hypothetical protein POPTR_013G093450v4 [Populus trichocarpa]